MGSKQESLAEPRKHARRQAKLRQATFEDYQQIAALESRYGWARSFDLWTHLWLGNPLYLELEAGWPIGWVVEDENKRIVGTMGYIPLPYQFEGRRIIAATGRAQVVEPAYRSASLLLMDRVINQPSVDLYLNNTVSESVTESFGVFQCPRVPVGLWDRTAFWITNYWGILEILRSRSRAGNDGTEAAAYGTRRFLNPLGYRLSLGAFLKDMLANNLRKEDVEVQISAGFDDRFDGFWEDLAKNNPRRLLAVRTREMLEWHFRYSLEKNRLWIVTVVDGARLAAYACFEKNDQDPMHLKTVRLVDFQSLDGSTDLLLPMLYWALRKCRNEGIHLLQNFGRWLEKGELMDTVAPYRRRLSNWSFFYRAHNPSLAQSLQDRQAWSPSLFDGDASL
ncbi:MAG: hypothetical protein ACREDV_01050 [Methylocella sp.]